MGAKRIEKKPHRDTRGYVATVTEKLKHPSVVEAVCEFRFSKGISYTMVPGAIAERLRRQFPRHEVLPGSMMAGIPEDLTTLQVPHHRFRSDQPNALVQTGPRLLTINLLPTYPGFEVFREIILNVLENYRSVADPGNPIRVGLRYINLIHSEGTEISDHLRCNLTYPKELPHPCREVAARLLLDYGEKGTLGLSVGFPSRLGDGEKGALLDLDFFWDSPSEFPLDQFPSWLEQAHEVVYEAFISTVREDVLSELRGESR
jgi:uncharacterized protein (TIGR04255 family)